MAETIEFSQRKQAATCIPVRHYNSGDCISVIPHTGGGKILWSNRREVEIFVDLKTEKC